MLRLRGTEQLRAQRTSPPVTDNSPNSTHSSGGKVRVFLHPSAFIIYRFISVFVDFRLVYLFGDHPFPPFVCVCPFHEAPFIFASRPWCSLSSVLGLYRCYCCVFLGCVHDKVVGSCADRAGSVCAWSYQSSRFSFWRFIFYLRRKTDCGSGRSLREICPFHVSP